MQMQAGDRETDGGGDEAGQPARPRARRSLQRAGRCGPECPSAVLGGRRVGCERQRNRGRMRRGRVPPGARRSRAGDGAGRGSLAQHNSADSASGFRQEPAVASGGSGRWLPVVCAALPTRLPPPSCSPRPSSSVDVFGEPHVPPGVNGMAPQGTSSSWEPAGRDRRPEGRRAQRGGRGRRRVRGRRASRH